MNLGGGASFDMSQLPPAAEGQMRVATSSAGEAWWASFVTMPANTITIPPWRWGWYTITSNVWANTQTRTNWTVIAKKMKKTKSADELTKFYW